jgi:hypothetical protein
VCIRAAVLALARAFAGVAGVRAAPPVITSGVSPSGDGIPLRTVLDP